MELQRIPEVLTGGFLRCPIIVSSKRFKCGKIHIFTNVHEKDEEGGSSLDFIQLVKYHLLIVIILTLFLVCQDF